MLEKLKRRARRIRQGTGSIFKRYFIMTSATILISFIILGGSLLIFVSSYWTDEKTALLHENTVSISKTAANMIKSGNMDNNGTVTAIVITSTLSQISNAIDADIFICNMDGRVVYCKEMFSSAMELFTGQCIIHNPYEISADITEKAVASREGFSETGTMGGIFDSRHFIVGVPIVVDGEVVGTVFATQSAAEALVPYVSSLLKMFAFAAIVALAIAFITTFIMTYQVTKPLSEMSEAARQYAKGNFESRIRLFGREPAGDDELSELMLAFNSMANELSTLESSRRSFVANVSHELKTPMTTIGGFIDGILDGTIEKDRQKHYLSIVSDEVKRLSRLVTGMLNMSKIEAGELDLKHSSFNISEMIFTILLSFEQKIEKKQIEISGLDTITDITLNADSDMINQVIYNLIDNAVKFTPENGEIIIFAKSDEERVIFGVRNTGGGVSSEEIAKIFDRFYKVDKSRSNDVRGAGLGLFIVKNIIELHGGQITARSVENEYTEFVFWLPK